MRVAVIGSGLAGCAAAYFLKRYGADVVLYDKNNQIAPGASGNDAGMVNPRFSAENTPESAFYRAGFEQGVSLFRDLDERVLWNECGALHFVTDAVKGKRFRQAVQNWPWEAERIRMVSAAEATAIAGIEVAYECLYLPESGSVSPRALCGILAQGIELRAGVDTLPDRHDADVIVLANAMDMCDFIDLPLQAVRGQVTKIAANDVSCDLRVNVHYGGYLSAARGGLHTVGATFQRWLAHSDILGEDDQYNLKKLHTVLPCLYGFEVQGHRAGVRATSPDHFPVIGNVDDGLYVSGAHGSHGIVTSIAGGRMLAQMIMGHSVDLGDEVVKALCPLRFKNVKS